MNKTAAYLMPQPGSMRYYSFRRVDPQKKQAINALFELQHTLSAIIQTCQDPDIAKVKFNWWRMELQRATQGAAEHPLAQALSHSLKNTPIKEACLQNLLDSIESNTIYQGYRLTTESVEHCQRAYKPLFHSVGTVLNANSEHQRSFLTEASTTFGCFQLLLNLRSDTKRGCLYLPEELLKAHGVNSQALLDNQHSDALKAALHAYLTLANTQYANAKNRLSKSEQAPLHCLMILIKLHMRLLDTIAKAGFPLFSTRIELTPLRLFFLSLRP